MKFSHRPLIPYFLTFVLAFGFFACASSEKTAEGPDASKTPAPAVPVAEAAKPAAPAAPEKMAQGTVEVQPSSEELARQQKEEKERQKQADLERMKREEAKPSEMAAPVAVAPAVSAVAPVEEFEKVYFDFDKYDIKPEFRDALGRNAAAIKKGNLAKVVLEGHCDERGTEEYNLALGERRAMAVKNYLTSLGVDVGKLYTISYGEERPAVQGHNEEAWSKNRRVQFGRE